VFLLWRGLRHPGYRQHWGERFFGLAPTSLEPGGLVWIHAVSVGETRAAQPLIEALLKQHPDRRILLTHGTPTGRQIGVELFGERVARAYLPYDLPWAVATFLKRQRPVLGLLVETEVWPNLVAACRARGIPLCLVNARLSESSYRGYRRFLGLSRPAFGGLDRVLAQTAADAERLRHLGAGDVRVTGNLKSDAEPDARQVATGRAWRAAWDAASVGAGHASRPVWLAASTREGEDAAVIAAAHAVAAAHPAALLIWVPRHPHRAAQIEAALDQARVTHQRRSVTTAPHARSAVWIGDSLGELAAYIAAADVVFMGGSIAELGGQNLLEPCAQGRPVIVGPHTFNFLELTDLAVEMGAAVRVADDATPQGAALGAAVSALFADTARRLAMADAAQRWRHGQRGSLSRTLEALRDLLPP
jgi:3-deoxy-D-manno-octulosonic-acid transferase